MNLRETSERLVRLLSRPGPLAAVHLAAAAFGLALGWALALRLRPEPVADLGLYWELAGQPQLYAKGGALFLALVPLRRAGLAPHVAAAVTSSVGWLALAWALWRPRACGPLVQLSASAVLLCFSAWFAGLFGIVNTDLPSAGLVAAGLRLLFRAGDGRWGPVLLAFLVLGLGLSMRVQTMAGLGLSAAAFLALSLLAKRPPPRRVLAVAAAGILLAPALEAGLRLRSADPAVNASTRLPLYSGLLATSAGAQCGGWTPEASRAAEEDAGLTLAEAARKRLPGRDVAGIVACKLGRFLGFSEVGSRYLAESLDLAARPGLAPLVAALASAERRAGTALDLALGLLVVAALAHLRGRPWREKLFALAMPLSIALGYLGLHAVVEILPRYVLGPVAFSLVAALQAVAWARAACAAPGSGRS